MAHSNGQQFTTYDVDNDEWYRNCAHEHGGGFWFGICAHAHITTSPASSYFYWRSSFYMLSSVEVRLLC